MNDLTKLQKQDIEDIMNLSPVQEGMLFHYLSEPESELYFEQLSFNMTGNIDILTVKKAWEHVTKTNEMLRAVYRWQKLQRPVQIILRNHVVPFIEYDLTELPEHEKQASLERIKIKDRCERIDLSLAPMRILFCTLEEHSFQMVLSHYHIILDGWSNGVLLKEFLEAYNAISEGKRPDIHVKSKYKQFLKWNNALDKNRHIVYWEKHLAGFNNKTLLPFDRKKGEGSVDTESYIYQFDEGLTDEIKFFVTDQNVTAATLLYTAWGVLLQKYNDNTDVVFGTTVSGRSPEIPGIESIVGLLINTIPLRFKSNAGQPISELLEIADSELRKRSEYECTPLTDIKTVVELDRTENLFDSIVVIENYPMELILENSKKFSMKFNSIFEMTNYKLTLVISIFDTIELRFVYDANVFNLETIERMSRHYENIIKCILLNPDIKIPQIDILTEDEKRNIFSEFNNTYLEYPREMTIHRLFEEQAQRTPENIAVVFGETALTYRELNNKANQLAEFLIKQGVAAKSIVGIMMDKSTEMVISLLAILKCGAAYLPIDISYPRERILYMLGDSNVKFFITTSEACKDIPFTLLQNIRPDNNGIIITKTREHIKEFNKLPLPDRSLIDITKYRNKIGMASVNNCISLQTTRGCPYQCIFCHKVWSKQHVYRSAENIYNEIEYYYKKGVTNFSILDDCFNLNMENGKRLFKMLINSRVKVRIFFPNGLRGDILTRDYIDLMAEAGVVNINLSLETASPRLQVLVKKYLDLEKFKNVIEYIAGQHPDIILELATMHGFPTETEEEAMLTLNFIKDVKWIHFPYIHILKIYPNTEMEEFALKNGVLKEDILRSVDLAYHEIPETLPFPKSFTRRYQAEFLNDYFLKKERLKQVLPVQMKILSKSAIVEKYRTYLPIKINSIKDVLKFAGVDDFEMPVDICTEDSTNCSYFDVKRLNAAKFPRNKSRKILFLDLSQHFSSHKMLYKVIEQPLGQLYILTYLNEQFGDKIEGRIYKSGIDFDSFDELKAMVKEFGPELIGIRTLSLYKEFFHQTVSLLRQWGFSCPILAGGPYATSDYNFILQDRNVDIAVLGEGEFTLRELISRMLENDFKMPDSDSLKSIDGIAFNLHTGANSSDNTRKVMLIDQQDSLNDNGSQAFNPDIGISSEDLAYVMYTSGSTGKPKGVMVEHRQVNNCIFWMQHEFNLKEGDIVLQRTNLTFDPSVWELFWPLYIGAVTKLLTLDQGKDAKYLIDLMRDGSKATVMYCPASLITGITYALNLNAEKSMLEMPILFIGAEPISRETINSFYSYYKGTVVNTYGPTECTINNTYCYLKRGETQKKVPIGKPVANNKIYILSKNLELLPFNIPGEIYIEGESVARGYINNIEKTNESFIKNPFGNGRLYRTGDIGKWLEDGNIEIMGRADQQVKIRGYRIELSEIEAAMMKNKSVIECAVIVKDGAKDQETRVCQQNGINSRYTDGRLDSKFICAYYTSDTDQTVSELREHLINEIPEYMVPSYFIRLEKIPVTPEGKVNKKLLPEPEVSINTGVKYAAPEDAIEVKLVQIWEKILGIERVGCNDNFFELGGHSLKATMLVSRVHKEFNVELPLREIFKTPTIKELSKCIKSGKKNLFEPIHELEEKEYYQLSSAQMRLFIINKYEDVGLSYNMSEVKLIEGCLNAGKLEKSLEELINRHEALRTSFEIIDGEPVQKINSGVDFNISHIDIGQSTVENVDHKLEKIIKAFVKPFDLSKAPLLRVGLVKLSEDKHIFIIDMHHIISDGTSVGILTRDIEALLNGKPLPPMKVQYKDYAAWQKELLKKDFIKMQEEYWMEMLSGELPVLNLPTDFARPSIRSFDGDRIEFVISKEMTAGLRKLASETSTTLYMILMSVYNILLSKYANQEDVIIGTPVAGRQHADVDNIVGIFVNTLVMRNYPQGGKTFKEFLEEVKNNALKAFENQDYPLDELVRKLKLRKDQSRNPLFDTIFVLQNTAIKEIETENLKFLRYATKNSVSKFDVSLEISEQENILNCVFEYCTKLFCKESMELMSRDYKEILDKILADRTIKLSEIELSERYQMRESVLTDDIEFNF